MTPEMADALVAHDRASAMPDDTIRCVIVTGAGERAFCAGSDIRTLDDYATPWNFRNRARLLRRHPRSCLKPTIAAVNGYAFGGGLETAMSCDIRIASSNAAVRRARNQARLDRRRRHGGGPGPFGRAVQCGLMIMTGDPHQRAEGASAGDWSARSCRRPI